jgi:lysine-N-methylase
VAAVIFMLFITALDETFAPADVPVTLKLQRALFWLNLVDSHFEKFTGNRVAELLDFIRQAACNNFPEESASAPPEEAPSRLAKLLFRLLAFQYARKDTATDLSSRWKRCRELLWAVLRITRGTGRAPAMQAIFREVPFTALEQPFGFPAECEELWTRYFRVKIQGLHFCGPASYGLSLVEGFQSLALIMPATMFIARWLAASQNRRQLTLDDVAQALTIADHHHGYSPFFGSFGFCLRVQILSQMGEITKLIRWYTR